MLPLDLQDVYIAVFVLYMRGFCMKRICDDTALNLS